MVNFGGDTESNPSTVEITKKDPEHMACCESFKLSFRCTLCEGQRCLGLCGRLQTSRQVSSSIIITRVLNSFTVMSSVLLCRPWVILDMISGV